MNRSCVKTSVCNPTFYEIYPPASQKAACIRLRQEKGARILGTTKLTAFTAIEEPIECVDYQAPWNLRADGYQSLARCSSDNGVTIASYQWVDIAVGSDSKFQSLGANLIRLGSHELATSRSCKRPGY